MEFFVGAAGVLALVIAFCLIVAIALEPFFKARTKDTMTRDQFLDWQRGRKD